MRIAVVVVGLIVGLAAAFWAGYGLCAYRNWMVWPTLMQSSQVSNARIMIKFADLIDRDSAAAVRAKALAIAKVSTDDPAPWPGYSFGAFLGGPLQSTTESQEVLDSTRQATASQVTAIRGDIARLCTTSPATDTYRYVCGR